MVECGPPPPPNFKRLASSSSSSISRSSSSSGSSGGATVLDDDGLPVVEVRPGDYAVCFGTDGPSLKDTAVLLGTALSDVTVSITRRVWRSYINAPEPPLPLGIGADK